MKYRLLYVLLITGSLLILIYSHQHHQHNQSATGVATATKTHVKTDWEIKNDNRRLAVSYAKIGFGWTGRQATCLVTLWTRESRFDSEAKNPKSSAFGIAQLLTERSHDPATQILRGARYIFLRYKLPCNALWHSDRYSWY